MKIDTTTGSVRFLKAHDLQGPTSATIERVEEKEIFNPYKGEPEPQIVAYFTVQDAPDQLSSLILNKTLQRQLMAALGSDETDDWVGREVTLFPSVAPNGKPCVRVSPKEGVAL